MMNKFSNPNVFNNKISSKINNDVIAKIIIQLKKHKKLNKAYSKNIDKNGIEFIDSILEALGIECEIDELDIGIIPEKGSFITV